MTKNNYECDKGWYPLINELLDKIQKIVDRDNIEDFEISQIKEKFGELRVYPYFGTDEIFDLIDEYTEKSVHTCEICGKSGETRMINGWLKTLCDEHAQERIEYYDNLYKNVEDK